MESKWIINKEELKEYVIGEDKNIYKKPCKSKDSKRNYPFKIVKEQYPNRFRLNGVYWSKSQLKGLIIKDPNPVEIYPEDLDCPF